MQTKKIIAIILMIVLTISGTFFVIISSAIMLTNTDRIIQIMDKISYFDSSSEEAKTILENYMPSEKANKVISKLSVKQNIMEIVIAINNNNLEEVSNKIQQDVKNEVINVLDKNIDNSVKESFATNVCEAYVNKVLHIKECNVIGKLYALYMNKLKLVLLILGIITIVAILTCVLLSKRTIKWALIGIYNIIILSIIVYIIVGALTGISIGNSSFTYLLTMLLNKYNTYIIIYILLLVALSVGLNTLAYLNIKNRQ